MSAPTLVTGSLGNIGSAVVTGLREAGVPVRAADLRADAVARRFGTGSVTAAALDFTDPSTWSAFDGVTHMFLMRPPQLSNIARDMVPALEAAKAAGVRHAVLLSLQGAEHNKVVPHAKLEAWLRGSGLGWTFVRPSFFMENLSTTHRSDIAERGVLMVPAGGGRTSFVAASDVAAVACAALVDPQAHRDVAWTPTGPEALTYEEVTRTLSQVLGRRITYGRPGLVRYARHARQELSMPWPMVLVTSGIYTVARVGKAGGLTDDVRRVTGRDPLAFRDWAAARMEAWQ
jgi:uncharacterized protein YbjT (DUF2867 family)